MADFKFDKPFMKVFGKLNDALDELINDIRHFKVSDYEYGVCNSSYKMRYISSQNVVDYIDMLARAFEKRMIETPGDIERFSVEAAKRMIEDNESDSFASAMPLGYTQDPATYENLSDILVGLRNDCFNKSCYSQFDMTQRHNEAMRDLQTIVDLKFYTSMKSLVNGLPGVLKSKGVIANSKGDISDILRESIEEFIIFAYSVNIITLSQIRDYIVPIQTYEFVEDENKNVITECSIMKTVDTDLKLNLPYSINIRNLALSDNSMGFKELRKAIEYITRNPASPVATLLLQFLSKEKLDDITSRTCDDLRTVDRLIKNDRCFCDCGSKEIQLGPNFKDQLFDIAYENQFIDGSYRRGRQFHGKATPSPITDTLNMVFKIFNGCGCDLTTNEEIAMNILRVSHAIKHCAETYLNIANIDLLREVLAIMGEIMTRDIIMLVNNNTIVIDYGKHRNETSGPPSYLYTEYFNFNENDDDEFFMEDATNGTAPAAAPPAPKPDSAQSAQNAKPQGSNTATTNSATGKNKVEVTYKNDKGEDKKATARFQRFLYWCRKVLASIFKKFNKDHAAEIKYVSSHADLNKKISEALAEGNGTFKINVNGLPQYKIKLDEIKPQIAEAVDTYLKPETDWDAAKFEGMLYPVGKKNAQYGPQIAKMANQNDKAVAVSNMILYGQIEAPQPHSGPVTADIFNDLINNITNASNLVQKFVQEDLVQPLANATEKVQQKMNIQIPDNADETNSKAVQQKQRAELIAKILTDTSNIFATTSVNTLTKDFYGISYETYAKIVNAYKAQHKDDQTQAQPAANNQAAATPAANTGGETPAATPAEG
jgi:hypothetical protein